MDILQKTFREIKDIDFKDVFKNCLFVFDTNTLLDLYRLPEETSNDLKRILEDVKVSNRIWIPFQVYLEITHNKLSTIKAQKATFSKVVDLFKEKIQVLETFEKSINNKLSSFELQKRHSVMKVENYKLNANFSESIEKLKNFIRETEDLRKNQPDFEKDDIVYKKIIKLFQNKIGDPFSAEELKAIYKEADERFLKNIPPGFEDSKNKEFKADKPEEYSYRYGNQEFIRKYGDLVLWKELLKKTRDSEYKCVIFVCNEKKPDWWQLDESKKKIKPRYELLNEIYSECPSLEFFTIFEVHQFLKQMTETYEHLAVKAESIKAAKEIPLVSDDEIAILSRNFINRRTYVPNSKEIHLNYQSYFAGLFNNIVGEFNDSRFGEWRIYLELKRNLYPSDRDMQLGIYEVISLIFGSFKTSLATGRYLTVIETEIAVVFRFNVVEKPQVLLKILEDTKNFMDGYYHDSNESNPFFLSCDPSTYALEVQVAKQFFVENKAVKLDKMQYYVSNGELFEFSS